MITGGRTTGVEAKKLKEGASVAGMNVNISIEDVRAEKDKLTFKYVYTIDYAPDVAKFRIEGEIFGEDKNAKALEESWKKSKNLEPAVAEELLTAITYSGTTIGTLLAFSLNVQAPINLPRARVAPKEQKAG